MPAVIREARIQRLVTLESRRWDQHDNRSIMSPTALAFLIPVLIVFFFAPFLCVFCIRKRRRDVPIRRGGAFKAPALERSEARERLQSVVEALGSTEGEKTQYTANPGPGMCPKISSAFEKECAICLSSLRAPCPPEPARLSIENVGGDETPGVPARFEVEQEEVFRLRVCGHEFHSGCLTSWTMLHKKSCPVCRALYYYEEPEKATCTEAQTSSVEPSAPAVEGTAPSSPYYVTNWHYFWTGHSTRQSDSSTQRRSIRSFFYRSST